MLGAKTHGLLISLALACLLTGCIMGGSENHSAPPQEIGAPTFSPNGGVFSAPVKVSIARGTDADWLLCTIDGANPNDQSNSVCDSIWVSHSLTLKAVSQGYGLHSNVSQAVFQINLTDSSIPWESGIDYGVLKDLRDGQSYRTVVIGKQTWMAENLRYVVPKSYCSDGNASYCKYFGRLYSWSTAMNIDSSYDGSFFRGSDKNVQGICPIGWHLPSQNDWSLFLDSSLKRMPPGRLLKARTTYWKANTGIDSIGFRALPSGLVYAGGADWYGFGQDAEFWSSSEGTSNNSLVIKLSTYNSLEGGYEPKVMNFSVRCIQN